MKLSGNQFIEGVMSQKAKSMVHSIKGEIPFSSLQKPLDQSVIAFITTAGVHLRSQEVFDVDAGDPSVRFIPRETNESDLMISHTHYDRTDADQDINCVFPLTRLKEIEEEGIIGAVAPTHYGIMGYIPNTKPLIEETIPLILKRLKEEQVDAVLLNPG